MSSFLASSAVWYYIEKTRSSRVGSGSLVIKFFGRSRRRYIRRMLAGISDFYFRTRSPCNYTLVLCPAFPYVALKEKASAIHQCNLKRFALCGVSFQLCRSMGTCLVSIVLFCGF